MVPEERIQSRLDGLVTRAQGTWNSHSDIVAWATNVHTIAISLYGPKHFLVQSLETLISKIASDQIRQSGSIYGVRGILEGIKSDFEGGHLVDIRSEIRGEVEANFLYQAHNLLEDNAKDPAAMLVGAVLEDSLRSLCSKHGVPEANNIEAMNMTLRAAGVYSLPQQQQVTAWAAIRNKAAHGRFGEYDIREVRLMHHGVSEFISKYLH